MVVELHPNWLHHGATQLLHEVLACRTAIRSAVELGRARQLRGGQLAGAGPGGVREDHQGPRGPVRARACKGACGMGADRGLHGLLARWLTRLSGRAVRGPRRAAVHEGERSQERKPEGGLESATRLTKSAHASLPLDRGPACPCSADEPRTPLLQCFAMKMPPSHRVEKDQRPRTSGTRRATTKPWRWSNGPPPCPRGAPPSCLESRSAYRITVSPHDLHTRGTRRRCGGPRSPRRS